MNIYKVNCFFQNNIFCVVHFLRFLCNSLCSWCISATLLVATLFYDVHFILSFFDFILSQSLKVSDHIFLWTYCFGFYDNHFTPGMAFSSLYDLWLNFINWIIHNWIPDSFLDFTDYDFINWRITWLLFYWKCLLFLRKVSLFLFLNSC